MHLLSYTSYSEPITPVLAPNSGFAQNIESSPRSWSLSMELIVEIQKTALSSGIETGVENFTPLHNGTLNNKGKACVFMTQVSLVGWSETVE